MSIGSKIRYYRTLAGMTQTELGEKCGVTYMTVSQWENDYAQPLGRTLLSGAFLSQELLESPQCFRKLCNFVQ